MTDPDPDLTLHGHSPQEIRVRLIDKLADELGPWDKDRAPIVVDRVVLPYVAQLIRELAEPDGDDNHELMHTSLRANFDQLADELENAGRWG